MDLGSIKKKRTKAAAMAAPKPRLLHSRLATGRLNRLGEKDRSGKSVGGMAWFLLNSGGRHRTVARNRVGRNPPLRLHFAASCSPSNLLLEILAAAVGRDAFSSLPVAFVSLFPFFAPFLFFASAGFSLLAAPMSTMLRLS